MTLKTMSFETLATSQNSIGVNTLLEKITSSSSEEQKDSKIRREIHHQRSMDLFDKNISFLKEQKSEIKKAAKFNFVLGLVSNFINIAISIIPIAFKTVSAAAINLISKISDGILHAISGLNKHDEKAQDAQVKAEEMQQLSQAKEYEMQKENEHLQASQQNSNTLKEHLENALLNSQNSLEATVNV